MEKLQSKMWAGTYRATTLAISILMKDVKRPDHHKVSVKHGNKKIGVHFFYFSRLLARARALDLSK